MNRETPKQTRYTGTDRREFLVICTWSPNEEPDTWVEYKNKATGQVYTCRLEAFLGRFSPLVD